MTCKGGDVTDGANIPFLLAGRHKLLAGLGEVGLHKSSLPPVVNLCLLAKKKREKKVRKAGLY